jgi:hypothetical protein
MADYDRDNEVTLTLTGERAERGISLGDFETFVDSFVSALRDYDRARHGKETRKIGGPDRRDSAASAFRLVRLEPGSAIATLVAERPNAHDNGLGVDDAPLALTNLGALTGDIASEHELPDDVVAALDRARRACGDDGAIELDLPAAVAPPQGAVRIDRGTIERLSRTVVSQDREVRSISGLLHAIDIDPDRLVIRSTEGVEWACRYDDELEPQILMLVGRVVWAEGPARLKSPTKGTMTVERIQLSVQGRQSALFVEQRPSLDDLLARQGFSEPQGLDAVADDEWVGDESDERYLAALFGEG